MCIRDRLDISRAIFAAPVTRLVLTTPTPIEGGDKALLAALAAHVTARDDRVAAVSYTHLDVYKRQR